jgi:hypothetical protein
LDIHLEASEDSAEQIEAYIKRFPYISFIRNIKRSHLHIC